MDNNKIIELLRARRDRIRAWLDHPTRCFHPDEYWWTKGRIDEINRIIDSMRHYTPRGKETP